MKNEAEIHRCRECKLLEPAKNGRVKIGVSFLDKHQSKRGVLSHERYNELLTKITYNLPDMGLMCCGEEEQLICSLRICDKENIYNPRKDMSYWFSMLRKATSFVSHLIPKHD